MVLRINTGWHDKNRIPVGATFEQRLEWHLAHSRSCNCRPAPPKIAEELRKRGLL
ncbi:MAG: hypothetical protein V1861_02395 [Candidatus Micrarchaeota archaeon]